MRIVTISGPLHREFGGPPEAATGIASALSILGHEVKIIVCGQSTSDSLLNSTFFGKLKKSSTEVQILNRRTQSKYGTFLRPNEMKSVWKDFSDSDFVVLHQIFALQYLLLFPILVLMKKPFAVMPHGTLTSYQRRQHRVRKLFFSLPTFMFLKSASAIFVATQQELKQLPTYLQVKGKVVGLGINTEINESISASKPKQTFNLLYMGRITKKKRLDIALQAFASVSKKSSTLMKFIICGTGEARDVEAMKRMIIDLEIAKEVDFRGWVDFSEKEAALLESDCFILTSEDENFAIAAAEALSQGVPCILSSNVALSSLVVEYNAGVVFQELNVGDIEDAIVQMSQRDGQMSRESALLAASQISWDVIARKWESAILEFVKSQDS